MNDADVDRYLKLLNGARSWIRRLTPNLFDPEDIFHDVLIALSTKDERGDHRRPKPPWLYAVARNIAIGRHRHELVRQCTSFDHDAVHSQAPDPCAALARKEAEYIIRNAVAALKPRQRCIVERRIFDDQSFSEIATDLNLPEETVRTRYKRAINQLRGDQRIADLA